MSHAMPSSEVPCAVGVAAKRARMETEVSLAQLDFDLGLDADPMYGLDGKTRCKGLNNVNIRGWCVFVC